MTRTEQYRSLLAKACYLGDSAEVMKQWAREGVASSEGGVPVDHLYHLEQYTESLKRVHDLVADLEKLCYDYAGEET